jgi:hypothetical protein
LTPSIRLRPDARYSSEFYIHHFYLKIIILSESTLQLTLPNQHVQRPQAHQTLPTLVNHETAQIFPILPSLFGLSTLGGGGVGLALKEEDGGGGTVGWCDHDVVEVEVEAVLIL